MALSENQKQRLAEDMSDLASATVKLAKFKLADVEANKLLSQIISNGVEKMASSNLKMEELANASQNLVRMIFSISEEVPEDRTAKELHITKGWKKLCPGCPPWC